MKSKKGRGKTLPLVTDDTDSILTIVVIVPRLISSILQCCIRYGREETFPSPPQLDHSFYLRSSASLYFFVIIFGVLIRHTCFFISVFSYQSPLSSFHSRGTPLVTLENAK